MGKSEWICELTIVTSRLGRGPMSSSSSSLSAIPSSSLGGGRCVGRLNLGLLRGGLGTRGSSRRGSLRGWWGRGWRRRRDSVHFLRRLFLLRVEDRKRWISLCSLVRAGLLIRSQSSQSWSDEIENFLGFSSKELFSLLLRHGPLKRIEAFASSYTRLRLKKTELFLETRRGANWG